MCGIAGLIRYHGLTAADRSRASRLQWLLRHRGPDGEGLVALPNAAFVQTRLALVHPDPHPLPLQSPDGRYTLTYNGEVYNHAALRRLVRHHPGRRQYRDAAVRQPARPAETPRRSIASRRLETMTSGSAIK